MFLADNLKQVESSREGGRLRDLEKKDPLLVVSKWLLLLGGPSVLINVKRKLKKPDFPQFTHLQISRSGYFPHSTLGLSLKFGL